MQVYDRGGERLVIMDVREALVQPFEASEWTDLRVGFMLSLTSSTANDNISSLTANIADNGTGVRIVDRYWIGVKDNNDVFPGSAGTQFIGFTNCGGGILHPGTSPGDSLIVSSDSNINTAGTTFYWPKNSSNLRHTFQVMDGVTARAQAFDGSQIHFVQNNATVYATCLAFRLTRPDTRSNARQITTQIKKTAGFHNGDIEYTSNPSSIELQSQLANFPTTVQQFGPVSMSEVPDTIFCYTPWSNSRLRIHAAGIYSVT